MKHICLFSGGAGSAYMSYLVAKKYPNDTILLFNNPKAEHPDSDRFRKQIAEYIGLPITEISDGRDLWELIDDNKCLPSSFIPFCSRILKQEPAEKYYKTLNQADHGNLSPFTNFIARAINESLQYYLSAFVNEEHLIPLRELAENTSYTQEYLSLRARQGKLDSVKIENVWYSSKRALKFYLKKIK